MTRKEDQPPGRADEVITRLSERLVGNDPHREALEFRQDLRHTFGQDQTCKIKPAIFSMQENQMAIFTARVMWKSRFPNTRNVQMPGFSRQSCRFFPGVFHPSEIKSGQVLCTYAPAFNIRSYRVLLLCLQCFTSQVCGNMMTTKHFIFPSQRSAPEISNCHCML